MGQEFNKYMDGVFDYLDQVLGNSIKVNQTFNSKMFRQEMYLAFNSKTDPIDFVEDFLRDSQQGFGESAGEEKWPGNITFEPQPEDMPQPEPGSCPTCHGVGFAIGGPEGQYDECPNCTDPATGATLPPERWKSTASDAGSKPSGLTRGYDDMAAVFGKKSEALGDPGSASARANGPGRPFQKGGGLKNLSKKMSANRPTVGGADGISRPVYCDVCNQMGGNPACKYCRDAEKEMGRADYMFGEAHGENAAAKSNKKKSLSGQHVNAPWFSPPRPEEKKPDKGPFVDDFGGRDPNDVMFFGEPDQEDAVGTMIDPKSPSDEFKGKKVQDFGEPGEGELAGFGDEMSTDNAFDDEDIDSIWGPEGHQELPGSDVQFPEYDPEDQAQFKRKDWQGKGDPWYGKERPKLQVGKDIRTTPDRVKDPQDDRFINFMDKGWRKAMGYEEGVKQDRGSAAYAQGRDMKDRNTDSKGFKTQRGGHFEFDPQTGDLKRSE